jgi:hypothetical protein
MSNSKRLFERQRARQTPHPTFVWGGIVREPRYQPGTPEADAMRAWLEARWKETGRRLSPEEARWWLYYAAPPGVLEALAGELQSLIPEITATEHRYWVFKLCLSHGMTIGEASRKTCQILKGTPFKARPGTMVKAYYDGGKLSECKHTVDTMTLHKATGFLCGVGPLRLRPLTTLYLEGDRFRSVYLEGDPDQPTFHPF